jgi:YD repeat-containing protein
VKAAPRRSGEHILGAERLSVEADLPNAATTTTYSPSGKPLTLSDPEGSTSRICYDRLDRARAKVDAEGRATQPSTMRQERQWKSGATSRPVRRTHARCVRNSRRDSRTPGAGRHRRFDYDLAGRPHYADTSFQGNAGWSDAAIHFSQKRTYDPAGRVGEYWYADNISGLPARRIGYGYDAAGNRTRLEWPDGWAADYRFDAANRMDWVGFPGGSPPGPTTASPAGRR